MILIGGLVMALGAPIRAAAQVGYDPAHSPFRDVTTRQAVTFFGGTFSGNTGHPGVGSLPGNIFGVRFRTGLSGPIELFVTGSYIRGQRRTINTTLPESTRVGGPIDNNMIAVDAGLGLTLTGLKTWHHLAPYIGVGIGIVKPLNAVVDPGGYRPRSGFTFVPTVGVRAHLSRTLSLQFEARDNTIRYEWPFRYFQPLDTNGQAITPPVLDGDRFKDRQLAHNLTLSAGLTLNFNF